MAPVGAVCHRCGGQGNHGDSWKQCVHAAFIAGGVRCAEIADNEWRRLTAQDGATAQGGSIAAESIADRIRYEFRGGGPTTRGEGK